MIHMELWQIWMIASLVMLVAEIFYPVFFFAALGIAGIIASLSAFFFSKDIQLIIFSLSGIVIFFAIRPIILKSLYPKHTVKTNIDAMIGKKGVVVEDIGKNSNGRVKIGDETWIGVSIDKQDIQKGQTVVVKKIEGTKIYVKKEEV